MEQSQSTTTSKGAVMTTPFKSKFVDGMGNIFTVSEVIQTPIGLTVYYINEETKQEHSCLLEAFGQRFREVETTTDPTKTLASLKNGFK